MRRSVGIAVCAVALWGCASGVTLVTPLPVCEAVGGKRAEGEVWEEACRTCMCSAGGVVTCQSVACPTEEVVVAPTQGIAFSKEAMRREVPLVGAGGVAYIDAGLSRTVFSAELPLVALGDSEVVTAWLLTVEPFSVIRLGECGQSFTGLTLSASVPGSMPVFDRIVFTRDARSAPYDAMRVIAEGMVR